MLCSNCTHNVHPVVALDIDNTLADWTGSFLTFLEWYLPIGITDQDPIAAREDRASPWWDYDGSVELSEYLKLDKRTYQDAKLAFRQGGFKRAMPEFANASAANLVWNAKKLGCEVWITTTRPWQRLDNSDPDTREWLSREGIDYDHLLYDDSKYEELCNRVEPERVVMVLEDQWDMYDDGVDFGLPMVLRKTNWNRAIQRPVEISTLRQARELLGVNVATWREAHGS